MNAEKKDAVRRLLEVVWSRGEIDAADLLVAEQYTIAHDPGDPWDGETLDLARYKERVRRSRAPCPDQRFDIEELIAEGDRVVVTWHWTGTHLGDMGAFPASGRKLVTSGVTIYYFDGVRIKGHWQVVDRLGVFQQLSR